MFPLLVLLGAVWAETVRQRKDEESSGELATRLGFKDIAPLLLPDHLQAWFTASGVEDVAVGDPSIAPLVQWLYERASQWQREPRDPWGSWPSKMAQIRLVNLYRYGVPPVGHLVDAWRAGEIDLSVFAPHADPRFSEVRQAQREAMEWRQSTLPMRTQDMLDGVQGIYSFVDREDPVEWAVVQVPWDRAHLEREALGRLGDELGLGRFRRGRNEEEVLDPPREIMTFSLRHESGQPHLVWTARLDEDERITGLVHIVGPGGDPLKRWVQREDWKTLELLEEYLDHEVPRIEDRLIGSRNAGTVGVGWDRVVAVSNDQAGLRAVLDKVPGVIPNHLGGSSSDPLNEHLRTEVLDSLDRETVDAWAAAAQRPTLAGQEIWVPYEVAARQLELVREAGLLPSWIVEVDDDEEQDDEDEYDPQIVLEGRRIVSWTGAPVGETRQGFTGGLRPGRAQIQVFLVFRASHGGWELQTPVRHRSQNPRRPHIPFVGLDMVSSTVAQTTSSSLESLISSAEQALGRLAGTDNRELIDELEGKWP